ncbi:hypothetical protein, partial [Deinococcus sp. GbtcB9]|uniref:hypothetical protein n=1 Tax=Deinococcus sp. GbtcB9 TaxID=2824754 RepID=UPI001C2FE7DA
GSVAPGSGRQVSFGRFRALLDGPRLLTLIGQALGLRPLGGERLAGAQGREVPREDVHFAPQGHAGWQGQVYNLHMSRARCRRVPE